MHEDSIPLIAFLSAIWSVSFAAALARSLADSNGDSFGRVVAIACTSGFVAIGVIGLFCGDPRTPDFNWLYYIAVSALIGGSIKDQDKWLRAAWRKFLQTQSITDEPDK